MDSYGKKGASWLQFLCFDGKGISYHSCRIFLIGGFDRDKGGKMIYNRDRGKTETNTGKAVY